MDIDTNNLPDNPELLKQIITDLSVQNRVKDCVIEKEQEKYSYLEEKYNTLRRLLFGKKSEKLTPEDEHQMRLFNEAEDGSEAPPDHIDDDRAAECVTTQVAGYTRKKGGRKPLPEYLHREEIVHDLTEKEKACPCCGKERPLIGEEATEELDIIPAKIVVNRHIRKKYGPCGCDEFLNKEIPEIKTASMPPRLVPQSIVSAGLAAYVITSKFCDALPFYRQSKIFDRLDVDLSRATLCNWAICVALKCAPLIDIIIEEIRNGPVIRMDETTLQVLKEPGRAAESKSYMWVAMGYTKDEKPLLLYQYHPTRSGGVPKNILGDYGGIIQTDGYDGYNQVVKKNNLIHAGCFAHARREFEKAMKQSKKSKVAYRGLAYIRALYKIESDVRQRNLASDEFVEKRRNAAIPLLEEFHNWLCAQKQGVLPQGYTGKAVNYALNQWDTLIRYLDHHLLTPDNNLIENAIRPFVLGRKNWLFSNTPRGAQASAVLYSLIESAKANKLEPYRYLRYLFDRIAGCSKEQ
ncbi:IS66 family transposase, partial [Candidatus Dependentiae bacterium]|nr:IS66 family transposase [Candidatus Dependentiae bacterium]